MDFFRFISPFNILCLEHFHFIDIVKGYAKLVFQTNCPLPLGRLRQYIYIEGQRLSYSALQCDGWLLGRHLGPFEEQDMGYSKNIKNTKFYFYKRIVSQKPILEFHLDFAQTSILWSLDDSCLNFY